MKTETTITEQEAQLLKWAADEWTRRMTEEESPVLPSSRLEFFEIEDKAKDMGMDPYTWGNPIRARIRWEEIGGYKQGSKLVRKWNAKRSEVA